MPKYVATVNVHLGRNWADDADADAVVAWFNENIAEAVATEDIASAEVEHRRGSLFKITFDTMGATTAENALSALTDEGCRNMLNNECVSVDTESIEAVPARAPSGGRRRKSRKTRKARKARRTRRAF